ncbi:MAG: SDR family NAD(P)-dependent oxidoreductase [Proteobacteria bacterium]|nr:MAG: SDR family NAD(P)-dependent oxidoreductase [Pseudomonadota bacterium]
MAQPKLKPVKDQVIVITGASSGIGLATSMMAAKAGAKVVIASRNTSDLEEIATQIEEAGGEALAVTADVSRFDDVQKIKADALDKFGRIDTWVNNAAGAIYGPVLEHSIEESRQLMETNFWGVHYGCIAAVEAMGSTGGVIVNVGSEVSERAVAPQTMYSASKHAVKGYTEGLRTELMEKGIPVLLSLVRPAGIDTPFTQHAANRLEEGEPSLPAPVYHPNVAAQAILACAVTGKRDVYAGGASKLFSVLNHVIPGALDHLIAGPMAKQNRLGSETPHDEAHEGLMKAPVKEGDVRGGHKGHVNRFSLYTSASLHPGSTLLTLGILGGLGWLGAAAFRKESAKQALSPQNAEAPASEIEREAPMLN